MFSYCLWLLDYSAQQKFMNFAGQPAARLNRDQAVYDIEIHRSILITILSPLLFFAPDVNLQKLECVFLDEMVNQVPWKAFLGQLQEDWKEFILYVRVPPSPSHPHALIPNDCSQLSCVRLTFIENCVSLTL